MTDDDGTFRQRLRIEAPPESVFAYFTDPARMARWMGIGHKLDPVAGGAYIVEVNDRDVVVGQFVEIDPPRRVVFTWGWRDSREVPPGSTTIEVNFTPDGDATLVDFVHRGLPADQRDAHARGWTHFMARLAIAGAGGDPGADAFATSGGQPP
jgi:uncharacterized protein YndB with AHSA1/START domain